MAENVIVNKQKLDNVVDSINRKAGSVNQMTLDQIPPAINALNNIKNHSELEGRDSPNQHTMGAITGLSDALGKKLETTALSSAIDTALAQAKASGEFNGKDGATGPQGPAGSNGADGKSVTHSWSGSKLTLTSASGTTITDLRGPQGNPGADGKNGTTGPIGPQGPAGKDGSIGAQGPRGYDFNYNWSGTSLGIKTSNEESYKYVNLKGATGERGPQGEAGPAGSNGANGAPGKTPVKGQDYFTTSEINAITANAATQAATKINLKASYEASTFTLTLDV